MSEINIDNNSFNNNEINYVNNNCSFSVGSKEFTNSIEINNKDINNQNTLNIDELNNTDNKANNKNDNIENLKNHYSSILAKYHIKSKLTRLKNTINKSMLINFSYFIHQLDNFDQIKTINTQIHYFSDIIIKETINKKLKNLIFLCDYKLNKVKLFKFKSWREAIIKNRLKIKFENEVSTMIEKKYSKKINFLDNAISQYNDNIIKYENFNENYNRKKSEINEEIKTIEKNIMNKKALITKIEKEEMSKFKKEFIEIKKIKDTYNNETKKLKNVDERLKKEHDVLIEKNNLIVTFISNQLQQIEDFEKNLK